MEQKYLETDPQKCSQMVFDQKDKGNSMENGHFSTNGHGTKGQIDETQAKPLSIQKFTNTT